MSFPILGFVALVVFYALFFCVGAIASRRARSENFSDFLLAGRRLPLWLGVLTMTATWVGGGYINGTAEAVYDPQRGLLWAQAPWCYALSLVLGGLFFAGRMRRRGYTTMLDLFADRYGRGVASGLYVPALVGDLFWSSAILAALGATFGTVLNLDYSTAVILSAAVAIGYCVLGGLWSVAYTDAIQLLFIFTGLAIALPFAADGTDGLVASAGEYVRRFDDSAKLLPPISAFRGSSMWGWQWGDMALLLILGGIPWQVYFQRVLACRTDQDARRLSIWAGLGCLLMAVPAISIGVVGVSLDWSSTPSGPPPHSSLVLPYVLRYATPPVIATLGLGAVAAAVMSSIDSSILSSATMFTWNLYRPLFRPNASHAEIRLVIRLAIAMIGVAAAILALSVQSVYTLWYLCADLVYVVLFPQLVMALFVPQTNKMGAACGAMTGIVLRFASGEAHLGISGWIPYPGIDSDMNTWFPFRTLIMLASLMTIAIVSALSQRWCAPVGPKTASH